MTTTSTKMQIPNSWKDDGDTYIYRGGKVNRHDKKQIIHVVVADFVTKIDDQAFERCVLLQTVEFSSPSAMSSLKEIGNRSFCECPSLRSVAIPSSVEIIGKRAFSMCHNLLSHNLIDPVSSSIRIIGRGAFSTCMSLATIHFPITLEKIGHRAFEYCCRITNVTFSENSPIRDIPFTCFGSCRKLHTVILPRKVETLSAHCFSFCVALSSIVLPRMVTVINKWGFFFCIRSKSVNIPPSVQEIGQRTFHVEFY